MGLNIRKIRLSDLQLSDNIRFDAKFSNFIKLLPENQWDCDTFLPLKDFISPLKSPILKKGELEEEYTLIELANIKRRYNTLVDLTRVSEIGSDKVHLKYGDIVIPKLEPKKGQFFLNLEHQEYIGSTELIEYKIDSEKINPIFLYFLLTTNVFLQSLSYLETGKTHKRVNSDILLKVRIPKIPLEIQNKAVEKIQKIEDKINSLKNSENSVQKILNKVIANHFKIDLEGIEELDAKHILPIPFKNVGLTNPNLRGSFRWNKMQYIQSKLYSKLNNIEPLSRYITFTKNGWSPVSVEGGDGTAVLGQENFSSNGVLDISPSKATEETRNNIEDFYIKKGDFFVSRGNTVDLVALASIVKEETENDIIYPDLYIKVEFDETKINKEYLSYIFNSFIGRLYFKYVSKGKNQTMVKVSSIELLNFMLPVPPLKEQIEIVEEIKIKLAEQEEIDNKIELKQQEINEIIEKAIIGDLE